MWYNKQKLKICVWKAISKLNYTEDFKNADL